MTRTETTISKKALQELSGIWFTPQPILDALNPGKTYEPASGTGGWMLGFLGKLK